MSDESAFEYSDVDRDGIPDALDMQVAPLPMDVMAMQSSLGDADADGIPDALDAQVTPAGEQSTDEALLELQAQKQRESVMTSTLTNIQNLQHEARKGIVENLRGSASAAVVGRAVRRPGCASPGRRRASARPSPAARPIRS